MSSKFQMIFEFKTINQKLLKMKTKLNLLLLKHHQIFNTPTNLSDAQPFVAKKIDLSNFLFRIRASDTVNSYCVFCVVLK